MGICKALISTIAAASIESSIAESFRTRSIKSLFLGTPSQRASGVRSALAGTENKQRLGLPAGPERSVGSSRTKTPILLTGNQCSGMMASILRPDA
jgi:hypothetical protein